MSKKEIRTEFNPFGKDRQVLYEGSRRVGEVKNNSVYDNDGRRVASISRESDWPTTKRVLRDNDRRDLGTLRPKQFGDRSDVVAPISGGDDYYRDSTTERKQNPNKHNHNERRVSYTGSSSSQSYNPNSMANSPFIGVKGIIGLTTMLSLVALIGIKAGVNSRPTNSLFDFSHQEHSIEQQPLIVANLEKIAYQELQAKNYPEAKKTYELCLKENSRSASAWNGLGVTNARLGLLEESIKDYKLAIQLIPSYGIAHYNLGRAYLDLDKPLEAIEPLARSLEYMPKDLPTLLAQADAYERLKFFEPALRKYQVLISIDPNNSEFKIKRDKLARECIGK